MAPASLKRKLLAFDTRTKNPSARKAQRRKKSPAKKKARKVKPDTPSLGVAAPPVAAAPLKPKVEYSPNALAKCQECRKKIQKEHKRFGIPGHCARYNKEIYRYYHCRCCPQNLQEMVPDALEQLAQQKVLVKNKERLLEERQGLFKDLKKLRLLFANRLEVSFCLVFSNEVLKELVVRMPTTSAELLDVHGIGEAKLKSFGDPIFTVIRNYKFQLKRASASVPDTDRKATAIRLKLERKPQHHPAQTCSRKKLPPGAEVMAIDDTDEETDIVMGASLTCEQLVELKFKHAADNGYMISVD